MKNPIVSSWYADPESRVYQDKLYIYVTKSLPYDKQKNLDVIVSSDLKDFSVISDIIDINTFKGVRKAVWAPSAVEKGGRYYLIFAANDIHNDGEIGGLYLGVSDSPTGKFRNVYSDGRPFLNIFYNQAQPIDAHFFKENNDVYLYYGGWRHLNVCKMNDRMDGFILDTLKEITPEGYVEAPCVKKIGDKYILMYSSGTWRDDSYCVKTAESNNLIGPFKYVASILSKSEIADGPGHNSFFAFNGKEYISYHRREIGDGIDYHRKVCIDEMIIQNDEIQPIKMT